MDCNRRVLKRVIAALCGDHVCLAFQWPPDVNQTVLEDDRRITEDEIYGSVDVTFSVELALRVDHEGVLVSLDGASVEDREI